MAQNAVPVSKPRPQKKGGVAIWNIATVLLLLGACCVSTYVMVLVTNPQTVLNPFPPVIPPTATLTPTPTLRVFPPTWTPTSTYAPLSFGTPMPSSTLYSPPTQTQIPPTLTFTPGAPTATIPAGTFFNVDGNISAIPATDKNPSVGCSWQGIGGVILDLHGNPLVGITLHLRGMLGFDLFDQTTLSGAAPQYGPSGYEFYLGGGAIASQGSIQIQIVGSDLEMQSEPVYIETFSDCQRNLILVNFRQIH